MKRLIKENSEIWATKFFDKLTLNIGLFAILASLLLPNFSHCSSLQIPNTSLAKSDTKICLCMIVKNESKIIGRCLESVKDLIDCLVICDTRSTDDTQACIQTFMDQTGIPGKIYSHEWKNFGYNRTLSAQAAQETLKELGFNLENTYLLFLDADMILKVDPKFKKQELRHDSYLMVQKKINYSYYNTRLARASLNWKSIGVTHEYWAADNNIRMSKVDSLYIDDIDDGGAKSDKYERDIKLLTQGLIDEPNNARYMFYLAQSYKEKGVPEWDKAIEWYTKRIEAGGFHEEVWMSKYMIGQCYQEKNDWDNALRYYLEAFQYHPKRAEPLAIISNYYLSKGKNDLACIFAKYGMKLAYPTNDVMAVSNFVYDYALMHDYTIGTYYTQFRHKGIKYIDRLILSPKVPYQVKENAHRNLIFYVEPLKDTEFISITPTTRSFIHKWSSDRYLPCNPSLYKTDAGYTLNCRTVNYLHKRGGYIVLDDDNRVRTENFLMTFDKEFNKISETKIFEKNNLAQYPSSVKGLEDMKIFELNNEIYFTATTRELHPADVPKICLGKLEKVGNNFVINKITLLHGPEADRCEKNWLPFVIDGELFVVYSYSPFIIYKPNIETGECTEVINKNYNLDMTRFRGSAAPIPFDDGYLLMIHEVVWQNVRTYIHRFVFLDKNLEMKKLSKPFTFKHTGVEFCSSMTLDHSNNKLIMAMGIEDKQACLCSIDIDYVRSLLGSIIVK